MADTATLSPTLPNPTTPAERANQEVPLEVKWEIDSYNEREKSMETETQVPDTFKNWNDIKEPFIPKESSSEPQGLRAGQLFFNVLESAPEQAGQRIKRVVGIGRDTVEATAELWNNYIMVRESQPADTPKTEEEQIQQAELNFTQQRNHETEAAVRRVIQEKEEMEDVRAGVAGMSGDQRAEKSGVQTGFRALENLRNTYTRTFTFLKERWSAMEEARKDRSAFEIQGQRSVDLSTNLLAQEGNSQVANQIMSAG